MKSKKIPLRKCIGCGEMKPKSELVRVVKNKENEISVDLKGKANGRGAYVCKDIECFENAEKSRRLQRALQTNIPEEVYRKLEEEIKNG